MILRQSRTLIQRARWTVATALLAAAPTAALAYVGPGAGLTAIGTVVALIAAVFLALVGFVWYPLKRMLRGRSAARATSPEAANGAEPRG